ncbi:type VI secretion system-associated protein TagF [Sinorhizobium fredii]|uniref:type VI secretion system-associated protein TagF n=1 Tax=Rhizobium fredii TaxID=380 RepID=UPI0004B408F3|nr:type VI secretion system-associated protein TagF [Sinorhizobium fredii]
MPIGVFGKYPGKRDFMALNLPKGVVGVIENWMQTAVAISRERLGRQWLQYYAVHPIWNFRLGEDIAGTDCIGALMPSIDGIGRYFPLCLIAHAPPGLSFPLFGEISGDWIEGLHARLLSALEEGDVPGPDRLLAGLEAPLATSTGHGAQAFAGGYRLVVPSPDEPESMARFAALEMRVAAKARSLFWTRGGQYVPPQILSAKGLPDPLLYTEMMGGPGGADEQRR